MGPSSGLEMSRMVIASDEGEVMLIASRIWNLMEDPAHDNFSSSRYQLPGVAFWRLRDHVVKQLLPECVGAGVPERKLLGRQVCSLLAASLVLFLPRSLS